MLKAEHQGTGAVVEAEDLRLAGGQPLKSDGCSRLFAQIHSQGDRGVGARKGSRKIKGDI